MTRKETSEALEDRFPNRTINNGRTEKSVRVSIRAGTCHMKIPYLTGAVACAKFERTLFRSG